LGRSYPDNFCCRSSRQEDLLSGKSANTPSSIAAFREQQRMVDGGCSSWRVHRHLAERQAIGINVGFGSGSSGSRKSLASLLEKPIFSEADRQN
jgi:hypothetical protein